MEDLEVFRRGITAHCLAAIGRVAKAEGAGGSASSAAQIIDLYALVYNKCPLTNDTASWEELGHIFKEMVVLGIEPLMRAHGDRYFQRLCQVSRYTHSQARSGPSLGFAGRRHQGSSRG